MVIYADELFLINLVSAYIMLYILGRVINKSAVRKRRLFLAAIIGALGAAVIFCLPTKNPYAWILRILSVFAMIFTAFFDVRKRILRQFAFFLLLCGIMIFSMLLILSLLSKPFGMVSKAGIIYFDIPQKIFLPAFALSYGVTLLFIKLLKSRKNKKYYIMTVTHNGKSVTVTALFDSGNLLREPVSGKNVTVLEWDEARKLFDADLEFEDIENHIADLKLRAVPYHSFGNGRDIIFAFAADKISIPEEKKECEKEYIGLYNGRLSKNSEYHALINAGLL